MNKHLPRHLGHGVDVNLKRRSEYIPANNAHASCTNLEVLQDIVDFPIVLDPLFLVLLGDFQRTRESVMDVVGVEGCSDLVDVAVDESLGPCHDGLGLRALLRSRRHALDRVRRRWGGKWRTEVAQIIIMAKDFLRYSPWSSAHAKRLLRQ